MMLLKKIFRKSFLGANLLLLPIANISMAERFEPIQPNCLREICECVIKTFFYADEKYAHKIVYYCGWGDNFLSKNLALNLETILFMVDHIGEEYLPAPYYPKEQKIGELKEIIRRVYEELSPLYKERNRLKDEEKSLEKEGKTSEAKKKEEASRAIYSECCDKERQLEKNVKKFIKTLSRVKPNPDHNDKDKDVDHILKHIGLFYFIQLIIGEEEEHFNVFADLFCNYTQQESDKRCYAFKEDVLGLISKDVPCCLWSPDEGWSPESRTRFIDIMKYFRERYKYLDRDILKDPIWYSLFRFLKKARHSFNRTEREGTFLTETSALIVQYPLNTMNPHDYRKWCFNVVSQIGWDNQDRLEPLLDYIETQIYTQEKWNIVEQFIALLSNPTEHLTSFAQGDFNWLYEEMSYCIDHHTNDGGIVFFNDSKFNQEYYTKLCIVKTIFDQISKKDPTILAFIVSFVQKLDKETATKLIYALSEQNHLNLENWVKTVRNQVKTITRDLESEEEEEVDAEETNLEPQRVYVCRPSYGTIQSTISKKIKNNPDVEYLVQEINEIDKKLINIKDPNEKKVLEAEKENLREDLKTIKDDIAYDLMSDVIKLYETLPEII